MKKSDIQTASNRALDSVLRDVEQVMATKKCKPLTGPAVAKLTGVDAVSKRGDVFTARIGFYYPSGRTSQQLVERIVAALPDAKILGHGEIWKPFRGGDTVAQGSHWWVTFTIGEAV